MLIPSILTRTQGKCGPIVPTSVRQLPTPNHSPLFVRYVPSFIVRQSPEAVTDPQVCQTNPQHVDPNTGEAYAYCSQECRAAELTSQQVQYSQQQQGRLPFTSSLLSTRLMHLPATATCSYPGCTLPATLYPDGSDWNYCSRSHE